MKKLFISLGILVALPVSAYEPDSTHAGLTQEIIHFYNLFAPDGKKLTDSDVESAVKGAIEEDTPPRYTNHFYDPVYNRAWSPGVMTSKEWAQSGGEQGEAKYLSFTLGLITYTPTDDDGAAINDFSWQRGIRDFVEGRRERAMESLGHVLHLLEDASVPEHTRNDIHISEKDTLGVLRHMGSPFEEWAPRFNRTTLRGYAEQLRKEGLQPIANATLNEYFDSIAMYSNNYFFSEDTIITEDYDTPKIVSTETTKRGEFFGYGVDDAQQKFELVKLNVINRRNVAEEITATLRDDHDVILNNYWSRLSRRDIAIGAGVVRLFMEEVENEATRRAQEQFQESDSDSWWNKVWNGLLGLFGNAKIGSMALDFGANHTASIIDAIRAPEATPKPSTAYAIHTPSPITQPAGTSVPTASKLSDRTILKPPHTGTVAGVSDAVTVPSAIETPPPIPSPTPEFLGGNLGTFSGGIALTSGGPIVLTQGSIPTPTPLPTPLPKEEREEPTPTPEPTPLSDLDPPGVVFEIMPRPVTMPAIELVWSSEDESLASYDLEVSLRDLALEDWGAWSVLYTETTATSLTYDAPQDNAEYRFRLRARDVAGNVSAWQERTADVSQKPVVINEVAWMGSTASFQDEWIELYNRTGTALSVSGWAVRVITVSTAQYRTIALVSSVAPRGYYLMERTDDETVSDVPADLVFTGSLNNDNIQLALLDGGGNIIDETPPGSSWPAGNNETKRTMERVRTEVLGSDRYNWFTNNRLFINGLASDGSPIFGTPKAQNSVLNAYTSVHAMQPLSNAHRWTFAKSPYFVPEYLQIRPGASLDVDEGVVVKFGREASMMVDGTIRANGSESLSVVFTAFADDEFGGDANQDATATAPAVPFWRRITISPQSQDSEFWHTVFRYGGAEMGGAFDRSSALVSVEGADAVFDRVAFERGFRSGLRLLNSPARVTNSTFLGPWADYGGVSCEQYGGNAILVQGGSPVIERNTIDGGVRGMRFCQASPLVRDNAIRNVDIPLYLFETIGELRGNRMESSGVTGAWITGTMHGAGTLTKDLHPYIAENASIAARATLTVEPGVIVKFPRSNYASLDVFGTLVAEGTPTEPIMLTALSDDSAGGDTNQDATSTAPSPGSWHTISFAPSSAAVFTHTQIRYGGGMRGNLPQAWTAVALDGSASFSFAHGEITDSAADGIQVINTATGAVVFADTLFARNAAHGEAAIYAANAHVKLERVRFAHNHYGIYGDYAYVIDASDLTFEDNIVDTYPADLLF